MAFAKTLGRLQTNSGFITCRSLRRWAIPLLALLGSVVVSFVASAAYTLQITEFMAINDQTLIDDDDDRSDWIEIFNPTKTAVNLEGWLLVDSIEEWPFPAATLFPNSYLVVFASGKDRAALGAPLHTNFKLRGEGEYLGLVDPEGIVVSEFFPQFPKQYPDVSYGLGREAVTEITFVATGATARALIPTDDQLGLTWTQVGFDDSSWLSGTTGVGYDYPGLIGLDVGAMQNVNESVYIRIPFEITELPALDWLILRVQFDDGMIAYLNGEEIARENAPDPATWNSGALSDRPDSVALSFLDIDVSSAANLLQIGENVLAFQGVNNGLKSSDLLLRPELAGEVHLTGPEAFGYLESPTPGAPNGRAFSGIAGRVEVSKAGGTFVTPFSVELILPEDASEYAKIRYTLDGSVPEETSSLYTDPLTISTSTRLRARVFEPGQEVGPTVSETYILLNADVVNFSSNLPVVLLDNFGAGWMPQNSFQPTFFAIFEQVGGRTSLTNPPDVQTRGGMKIRGSSTAGRPKPSLNVEAWNEVDEDKNISPLGMPAESDWILWGPYNFDLALMRNPLIYELSNQVGRYATRSRFVEVFLNTDGGPLSQADYWGVYALMEKISRDEDRVDVERLFPEHDRELGISGGYMLKIDRPDPGDSGFYAAGQNLLYVYPKEVDMERPERDAQEQYIRAFFNGFYSALNSADYRDPEIGYAKYIDVDSWIDHHLLNVLPVNVDAFRLSGYMFKRRSLKLQMGPIWDFDRSMGSTDGRDSNPRVWRGGGDGTDFFHYPWWERLFTDINFFQRYIDRWQELRKGPFSLQNIHSVIDSMADEVREAQVRDVQRWNQRPRSQYGGTYQGEVDHLKQWLADRVAFMDSQFVSPPEFSNDGGYITPGFELTITASSGLIYYTLDGSDPRMTGGRIASQAHVYLEPITLTDSSQVTARVLDNNHVSLTGGSNPPLICYWSGPITAWFSIHPAAKAGSLVVTEINYNPLDPTTNELLIDPSLTNEDFEFIELKNVGTTTLDLTGAAFTNGIEFCFTGSGVTALPPGDLVVLVKNLFAFSVRYGAVANVAGEYSGNLDNGGEYIRLNDATGQVILDFHYDDGWYPNTDGLGFSLVILNENAPLETWGDRFSWFSSAEMGGSPGQHDPVPPAIVPVIVNEALTDTDPPGKDAIELYNPTSGPADIGGWFLTDDHTTPRKFRIPEGTVIPEYGYLIFDEDDFNGDPDDPSSFSLNRLGGEVYLFSADSEKTLTNYLHGFAFGAAANGVSFGRFVTSIGEEHFPAQVANTLGFGNAAPRIGPVVINEIMYHPADGDHEFIELTNISDSVVRFADPVHTGNTWKVEGIGFAFPEGVELEPGGRLLLVQDTVTTSYFRITRNIPDEVQIFNYSGSLDNGSETVRVQMPGAPEGAEVPYIDLDRVTYADGDLWPREADGSGPSLERIDLNAYGDDVTNWTMSNARGGTPGADWRTFDGDGDGMPAGWEVDNGLDPLTPDGTRDPDADKLNNRSEYQQGTDPNDPDTDDDGLLDGAEVNIYGTDPNDPDSDKDGQNDGNEVLAGTDPVDDTSWFAIAGVTRGAEGVSVRWTSVPGKEYKIYGSADMANWTPLGVVIGDGEISTYLDLDAFSDTTRFYRIEVTRSR